MRLSGESQLLLHVHLQTHIDRFSLHQLLERLPKGPQKVARALGAQPFLFQDPLTSRGNFLFYSISSLSLSLWTSSTRLHRPPHCIVFITSGLSLRIIPFSHARFLALHVQAVSQHYSPPLILPLFLQRFTSAPILHHVYFPSSILN
jgi:hypothetical protein